MVQVATVAESGLCDVNALKCHHPVLCRAWWFLRQDQSARRSLMERAIDETSRHENISGLQDLN